MTHLVGFPTEQSYLPDILSSIGSMRLWIPSSVGQGSLQNSCNLVKNLPFLSRPYLKLAYVWVTSKIIHSNNFKGIIYYYPNPKRPTK